MLVRAVLVFVPVLLLAGSGAWGAVGVIPPEPGLPPTLAAADTVSSDSVAVVPASDRVVVRYFHRTARCDNCLTFEAYTDSLLHAAFGTELSEGVLEWQVVNLDEEGNEAFVERYALDGIALVCSVVVGGSEVSWKSLDGIWWLVDDRGAFADYVTSEVRADLEAARGGSHRTGPPAADSAGSVGVADDKKQGGLP